MLITHNPQFLSHPNHNSFLNKPHTDHSLPTSHLSPAPDSDCGAVEIQHRTLSLPSPPLGVRCPPPWARTAQTALLQCSALGRWPPGETRPGLIILPPAWESKGCFFMGDYCCFQQTTVLCFLFSFPPLGDSSVRYIRLCSLVVLEKQCSYLVRRMSNSCFCIVGCE